MRFLSGLGSRVSPKKCDTEFVEEVFMPIQRLDRLLTIKQITAETGISRSTIYRLTRKGVFPKPIPIGDRGKRWPEFAIKVWLAGPRATD